MAILCKYLIASIFPVAALAAPPVQRDMITDIVTEIVWAATAAPEVPATCATALDSSSTPATSATSVGSATSVAITSVASSAASSPPAGSATGTCEGEGNTCVGDVTHWDGGLGACGTTVDTDVDLAIALPYQFMGTLSNTNPYCGRTVTLYNPTSGTTVQTTVRDKCMGCQDRAIDCTNILFNQITDNMGNGRMSGIQWWLN